jgi:hypothetical protein
MSSSSYHEFQRFHRVILVALIGVTTGVLLWSIAVDAAEMLWAPIAAVLVTLWLTIGGLTTTVAEGILRIRLLGLFRKRIPLTEIERAEVVTFRPILDCGGWGLRLGRLGWYWTARGNRGVALRLRNGQRLVIGSQRPEALHASIQSATP